MLLVGGPHKAKGVDMYTQFAEIPTHTVTEKYHTPNGLMLKKNDHNRNQTITIKDMNTIIQYRFIGGGKKITGNCRGLRTLLDEDVREEIDLMVQNGGKAPDAIVIQSGPHDMCNAQQGKNKL